MPSPFTCWTSNGVGLICYRTTLYSNVSQLSVGIQLFAMKTTSRCKSGLNFSRTSPWTLQSLKSDLKNEVAGVLSTRPTTTAPNDFSFELTRMKNPKWFWPFWVYKMWSNSLLLLCERRSLPDRRCDTDRPQMGLGSRESSWAGPQGKRWNLRDHFLTHFWIMFEIIYGIAGGECQPKPGFRGDVEQ